MELIEVCDAYEVHQHEKKTLINDDEAQSIALLFKMLADPSRMRILDALSKYHELCVCDLMEELKVSQSALSHNLTKLKQVHIIKSERRGKNVFYSFDDQHIIDIYESALAHIGENHG